MSRFKPITPSEGPNRKQTRAFMSLIKRQRRKVGRAASRLAKAVEQGLLTEEEAKKRMEGL